MAHVLTLALALIIAVLTLSPLPAGPQGVAGGDKIGHILAFAAVAAPLAWRYPRHWVMVAVAASAYGGLIEIIQPLVGRKMEFADLLADTAGAFFGAWVVARVRSSRRVS